MSISKSKLLLFSAAILLASCKKDKTVSPDSTSSQQYYVKGTLNGNAFDWEVDNKNWGLGFGMTVSTDQNNNQVAELQGAISSYTSKQAVPNLSVGFRTFQVGNLDQPAMTAYFNGFITTGNWDFATDDILADGIKKIVIYYNDTNGNSYSSAGLQTGNTANITSVKQVPALLGKEASLDIKLTFSCTMYNLNGYGPNITLSNTQANINVPDLLY
jgi:hypothetical protein